MFVDLYGMASRSKMLGKKAVGTQWRLKHRDDRARTESNAESGRGDVESQVYQGWKEILKSKQTATGCNSTS